MTIPEDVASARLYISGRTVIYLDPFSQKTTSASSTVF